MTLVCPKCGRAFEGTASARAICSAPGCNHVWDASPGYEPTIVSQEERKAVHLLVVTYPGGKTEEVPLASSLSIGRSAESNLVVNDLRLSRKHFQIERRGESFYLKDLGSSAGTNLNGKRAVESKLSPQDVIHAGETRFQYTVRFLDSGDTARKVKVSVVESSGATTGPAPRIALTKDRIVLGRGADCDVVLSSPVISRRHAALVKEAGGVVLEDLGAANGVSVNGQIVKRKPLAKGDRIRIGPYVLTFDGTEFAQEDQQGRITLEAVQIGKMAGTVEILRDVSVVIRPNEFVGLLGPSGAGKSTFMDTLNGFRPATSGRVLVNGEDLYQIFNHFKTNIGYVPQDDIIHRELTVWDALYYTAKLRLPEDTSDEEITKLLDEIFKTLELDERKHTRISALSGGQRKRVSVGVELITKPPLLFLDEPTSGLDPGTEEKIMNLFRRLAKGGRTVVLTTHVMENVELLDLIVVLVKGRLAYYGPPKDALAYFDIPKITKIYDKLESKKPQEWADAYMGSSYYHTYVLERQAASRGAIGSSPIPEKRPPMPHTQFLVLLRRYLAALLGDRRNLIFLLLPAPLIGFLMTIPLNSDEQMDRGRLILFMVITAAFIGCFNAYREIVKEKPIYKRERMVNLQIIPYVMSKLVVLSVFFFAQIFLMLTLVSVFEDVPGSYFLHFFTLMAVAVASAALGLTISAVVNSQEKAIGLLIVVLLPQIIFSGLIPLRGGSKALGYIMVTYWGYDVMKELACGDSKFQTFMKAMDSQSYADSPDAGVIFGEWIMIGIHLCLCTAATLLILRSQDLK